MNEISKKTGAWLIELARQSIEYFLETKNFLAYEKIKIPIEIAENVNQNSGGFILLEMLQNEQRKAYIRGENGVFERVEQLGKLVTQIAVNAAFFDTHTPRLKAYELNELKIHLIIPTDKIRIWGTYAEVITQLEGVSDGVIVEIRGRVAYDLPQIVLEHEESAEHRLRRLRLRLGISKKSAESDAEYYTFSVQSFREN